MKFDIDKTMNGKQYVIVANNTGSDDGWEDYTKEFETYQEAKEWLSKIKYIGE